MGYFFEFLVEVHPPSPCALLHAVIVKTLAVNIRKIAIKIKTKCTEIELHFSFSLKNVQ